MLHLTGPVTMEDVNLMRREPQGPLAQYARRRIMYAVTSSVPVSCSTSIHDHTDSRDRQRNLCEGQIDHEDLFHKLQERIRNRKQKVWTNNSIVVLLPELLKESCEDIVERQNYLEQKEKIIQRSSASRFVNLRAQVPSLPIPWSSKAPTWLCQNKASANEDMMGFSDGPGQTQTNSIISDGHTSSITRKENYSKPKDKIRSPRGRSFQHIPRESSLEGTGPRNLVMYKNLPMDKRRKGRDACKSIGLSDQLLNPSSQPDDEPQTLKTTWQQLQLSNIRRSPDQSIYFSEDGIGGRNSDSIVSGGRQNSQENFYSKLGSLISFGVGQGAKKTEKLSFDGHQSMMAFASNDPFENFSHGDRTTEGCRGSLEKFSSDPSAGGNLFHRGSTRISNESMINISCNSQEINDQKGCTNFIEDGLREGLLESFPQRDSVEQKFRPILAKGA